MAHRIQLRRDTAADWTSSNPVLSSGEAGYESDTNKLKIGDGATSWQSLPYFINSNLYENLIDEPPASPHAKDDEFNDESLDPKWSWVNASTWVENGSYAALTASSGGNHSHIMIQTAPTGDFELTCKIALNTPRTNYFTYGLVLYNSGNNKHFIAGMTARDNVTGVMIVKMNSTSTYLSDAYLKNGWNQRFLYVKVSVVGTNYIVKASYDGLYWWTIFTEAIATFIGAITHIGLGIFRNNTDGVSDYHGRCDWFRVTE